MQITKRNDIQLKITDRERDIENIKEDLTNTQYSKETKQHLAQRLETVEKELALYKSQA